ncbi:MAG: isoprenylcysteine carboxylmethyltransferase family protein [Acidobacteria bacterium]|nr:isoprenylcysteine carboxylmethyltransferase family protein [Acidobacteriota bacterium]
MLDLDAHPRLRLLFRIARLRVALGFAAAAVTLALARPTWGSLATGALLAAAGEALRIWAAGHLVKGREVTTSGPYRFTGHPLYLGSLVIGVGCVVAAASPVVAAVVLAYLAVMLPVAIRLEEATLAAAFGDSYTRYRRGAAPRSGRRFSVGRARSNREHLAVAGLLAGVALGALRAWWLNGWP